LACDGQIYQLKRDTSQVKLAHTVRPVFDKANLVSAAGLVPALTLADRLFALDWVRRSDRRRLAGSHCR
jgi:hypothetical protein